MFHQLAAFVGEHGHAVKTVGADREIGDDTLRCLVRIFRTDARHVGMADVDRATGEKLFETFAAGLKFVDHLRGAFLVDALDDLQPLHRAIRLRQHRERREITERRDLRPAVRADHHFIAEADARFQTGDGRVGELNF